jgi:alpha-ketoglutarate-dependent taurine dioxygenase
MNHWFTELIYLSTFVAAQGFTASSFSHTTNTAFGPTTTNNDRFRRRQTSPLPYQTTADPKLPGVFLVDFPKLVEDSLTKANEPVIQTRKHSTSLNDVDISFGLPVVVRPKHGREATTAEYLSLFLRENKEWIDIMMLRYGAVFFRDFEIETAQDVEDSVKSYNPNLNDQYRGTSPRNTQGGTEYVFSAAEVPSHWPIAQHIEMSFLPALPKQLYFSALKAPQSIGGETALADFRKVYEDLPKRLRQKLATKKLRYTRTHSKSGAKKTHDVAAMLGWPEMFGTSDRGEVERLAAEEGMSMRWEGQNNDIFVSEFQSEPFQLHPESNVPVFFNHANVFHWTSFPAELFASFRRTKDWRFLTHALKVFARSVVQHGLLRKKMALHVTFGDGTPISIMEMQQIRKAIHKNMVFNRWQKGDLLLIDNMSTSHGRRPTYDKGRNIVVAWSDPIVKENKEIEATEI